MYHLLTNPQTGGTPIIEREATAKAPNVQGMRRPIPDIRLIFFWWVAT